MCWGIECCDGGFKIEGRRQRRLDETRSATAGDRKEEEEDEDEEQCGRAFGLEQNVVVPVPVVVG